MKRTKVKDKIFSEGQRVTTPFGFGTVCKVVDYPTGRNVLVQQDRDGDPVEWADFDVKKVR